MSDNAASRPQVAVIGLGTMGSGMAHRLLDQGFTVDVWNRTSGPMDELAKAGATPYPTPAQAVARADVVVTMLPTAASVIDVMVRGGALEALRPGSVWAQMGTIGLQGTERLAAEVAQRRPAVMFVDAPVAGSREPARNGRLEIYASGPDPARALLEPVFAALGQRTLWLGPAGRGSCMKLVNNALLAFEVEAVAEVHALASRLGVPYATLVSAVADGPLASTFEMTKLAKIEAGDSSTDFSLEWALKDLDLVLAATSTDSAPVTAAIAERWRHLVEDGYGRLDVSAARFGLVSGPPTDTQRSA